jgi:radical SAM protein with 4Fe4S-binding SPASM domain
VNIHMTVNPWVVGRMKQTIRLVEAAGADVADCITLHHLWFITAAELEARRAEMRQALACPDDGARAHVMQFGAAMEGTAVAAEMDSLRGNRRLEFFPDLRGRETRDFYSEGHLWNKGCRAAFRGALVKPNGEVRSCPDEWTDGYVLGNIREQSFEDVWNGEKARRFRSVLLRKGSFTGCKRCSWMHCF